MTTTCREAWLGWAAYAVAVHAQLVALVLLRPHGFVLAAAVVLLGATLASALLSVVHDAGHNEFDAKRDWVNNGAVHLAVPTGLWVAQYRTKHRTHHKQANVFPVDESTRPHPLLRVHAGAPLRRWHRGQHVYAPALYALAWLGDVRSQLSFLRTGVAGAVRDDCPRDRLRSFALEKLCTAAVLSPYVLIAGPVRFALVAAAVMSVTSLLAALVLLVGHVNVGVVDEPGAPFLRQVLTSTTAFSTSSPWLRRLTGGLTHHQVHHLRPHAPRSTFSQLHTELIVPMSRQQGVPLLEFPSLRSALAGHFRMMRQLGRA